MCFILSLSGCVSTNLSYKKETVAFGFSAEAFRETGHMMFLHFAAELNIITCNNDCAKLTKVEPFDTDLNPDMSLVPA